MAIRGCRTVSSNTCAASAKARAVTSGLPLSQSMPTLRGACGQIAGASSATAASRSRTTGASSKSISIASRASRASASVLAITATTGWPTYFTESRASTGRSGSIIGDPSLFAMAERTVIGPTPRPSRSAAVSTASTPSAPRAASTSRAAIRPCAMGERSSTMVRVPSGRWSST